MSIELNPEQKYGLITRNLQEVLGGEEILKILKERDLKLYWGTAPTGRPHIGYYVPMSKIADFLSAGAEVTILLADIHAFLDNMKAPLDLVEFRTKYYEVLIKTLLGSIGVPIDKLKFIVGSSYQLTEKYNMDNYRLWATVTEYDAKNAGTEVVKQVESALLSGLLYPGSQALDEEYLGVDAQFGGVDQRKIFVFAENYLPHLGYKKRAHLMNPMIPGLVGSKMSSSDPDSKIDLLDDAATISRKLKRAFCEEGNINDNGILSFVKSVLFPIRSLSGKSPSFVIKCDKKRGDNVTTIYSDYQSLEDDFRDKKVHPDDLKAAVAEAIYGLLEPIRNKWENDVEFQKLTGQAYPELKEIIKKNEYVQAPGGNLEKQIDMPRLDIRIAKIIKTELHQNNTDFYVSTVDVGDVSGKPRTIVSESLVSHISLEQMQDRYVLAVCNFKTRKFQGIESRAILLAALSSDGNTIELLDPPAEGEIGENVIFEGYEPTERDDEILDPKLNIFEIISENFKVNKEGVAIFKYVSFKTSMVL